MDLDKKLLSSEVHQLDYDAQALAKGGFDHFMLKEIFEQPETIKNAMRGRLIVEDGAARLDGLNLVLQELRQINRIIFVACGTSWHAALVGEYMIEEMAGGQRRGGIRLGIPLPQSHHRPAHAGVCHKSIRRDRRYPGRPARGQRARAPRSWASAMRWGRPSPAKLTAACISTPGPEIGVASTKAFTSQLTVIALLTLLIGKNAQDFPRRRRDHRQALEEIPKQIKKILKQNDAIKEIAKKYYRSITISYIWDGRIIFRSRWKARSSSRKYPTFTPKDIRRRK